jgi:O-methyltransferase involved in polyketide biosynthesis
LPPQEPLPGVGKTALGAAMIRARESRRGDRLFDDAYAQAFVDAAPGAFPEAQEDLRQDWTDALATAGFDPTGPAAWLAEGLLLYLTADEARRLLTVVTEFSAPGSRLSFEHSPMDAAALAGQARQMPALRQYAALWKGGLGDGAPAWLAGHGWQSQFHGLAALAGSYRRPVPRPAHGGFLTAARQGG